MRTHRVTFMSPGTLFAEQSTCEIPSWDPVLACDMAQKITERHGAKPYGFYFSTLLTALPVDDGEGGKLSVELRQVERSGMYFLGGTVETLDEIAARNDPREAILRRNLCRNNCPIVVVNTNSWQSVQPFTEKDVIVDEHGDIIERGDTSERIAYRAQKVAEHRAALG